MITILLEKILTALTGLLTGLKTKLEIINEALNIPVIVKTVTGSVCNFTANIARKVYSCKTTITASGGGGTPSDPVAITGTDTLSLYLAGSDTTHPLITEIDFDNTCYGGEYDASTGKLKIIHGCISLDDTTITWDYNEDKKVFRSTTLNNIKAPTTTGVIPNWLCEGFSIDSSSHVYNNSETYDNSIACATTGRLYISYQTANGSLETFNEIISGKKLVYELNEAIEINVGSVNVTPEIGENNIWYDSGNDTTVIYYEKLEV